MKKRRGLAWLVVVLVLAVILAGMLAPNAGALRVEIFWLWTVVLPMWAIMMLSLAVGFVVALGLMGVVWIRELQRRLLSEQTAREIEAEVNALRRLLAEDKVPAEALEADGR